jgi:hypothetical protein
MGSPDKHVKNFKKFPKLFWVYFLIFIQHWFVCPQKIKFQLNRSEEFLKKISWNSHMEKNDVVIGQFHKTLFFSN